MTSSQERQTEMLQPDRMSTNKPGETSGVEEKALNLLGAGVGAEQVAAALGVTPARISQLLSDKNFSDKVTEARYRNLQSHTKRDNTYDSLEDKLLSRLEKSLPLMVKPDTLLKAIAVVNSAKRRGQSAPDQLVNQNNIVNVILPQHIVQTFTTNINNQVTKAGNQELLTMQSGTLLKRVEAKENERKSISSEVTKQITYSPEDL